MQNTSAIVWGLTKVDIYIEQIVKASVFVRVREINFKDEHEEMRTQLSMILRNLSLLHQTKTGFHDYSPYNRMEKIWSLAVIYHN